VRKYYAEKIYYSGRDKDKTLCTKDFRKGGGELEKRNPPLIKLVPCTAFILSLRQSAFHHSGLTGLLSKTERIFIRLCNTRYVYGDSFWAEH